MKRFKKVNNSWQFKNEKFEISWEEIKEQKLFGFVYLITEVKTGIQYIGEKGFISFRTPKGKANKQRFESNWKEYPSSNVVMASHIKKSELERNEQFKFEILGLAKDKSVMKALEVKYIMALGALESDKFLNENVKINIMCSIKDFENRVDAIDLKLLLK